MIVMIRLLSLYYIIMNLVLIQATKARVQGAHRIKRLKQRKRLSSALRLAQTRL